MIYDKINDDINENGWRVVIMEGNKIALLIDIENVSPKAVEHVIDDLSQKGVICIKRIYCVTDKLNDESVKKAVRNNNLEIRTQFNVVSGKSASDFNLVIDAMEILYTKDIDCFAIVSSDSDFNVLVTKLKAENKMVIGYGEQKTKPEYRSNYNEFIFVENLSTNSKKAKKELIKESQVKTKEDLEKDIYTMIDSSDEESLLLTTIKEALCKRYPDFDERTYGYKKFLNFISSMNSLKVEKSKEKNVYVAKLNKDLKKENKNEQLKNLDELRGALVSVLKNNKNKVYLAQIIDLVKKEHPSFSLKNFGFGRIKTLIKKTNWPEMALEPEKNPRYLVLNETK